jgi:hypothetical protein
MNTSLILPFLFSGLLLAQSHGAFTSTGSMSTPRFAQTATLLLNGEVLVAGGLTLCYYLAQPSVESNTAELYDPAKGQFSLTGYLSRAPITPAAFYLQTAAACSRRVTSTQQWPTWRYMIRWPEASASLGIRRRSVMSNRRRYSTTGLCCSGATSRSRSPLPTAQKSTIQSREHSVPSPDGPVRIHGHWPCWPMAEFSWSITRTKAGLFDPATGAVSRFTGGNPGAGVELYNPPSGAFKSGTMPLPRDGHTATLLPDGSVLLADSAPVVGNHQNPSTATASIYYAATGTFIATGSMSTGRSLHTATLLNNGQVLITGGNGLWFFEFHKRNFQRRSLHASRAGSSPCAVLPLWRWPRSGRDLARHHRTTRFSG